MSLQPITSVLPLLDPFDAFILDQWGVLHDGVRAYPEAVDAVERLLAEGKVIVTLSNSGRRADFAAAQMRRMGLPVDRFRANVTSGEAAVAGLRQGEIGGRSLPGGRCYLVCRDADASVIADTDIDRVDDPGAADFIMLSGIEGETRDIASYLEELAPAIARGLPVICTNPDLVAVSPTGNIASPGALAQAYAERTDVEPFFVGKPHAPVYELCRRALPDVASSRIIAIGDSLEHDIKGAHDAGFATCFCLDGIHGTHFDLTASASDNAGGVRAVAEHHGVALPDYITDRLRWS